MTVHSPITDGLTAIPAGCFVMGSDRFFPEERPTHPQQVDRFWMDTHPVTTGQFRRFVTATGYVTRAERALDAADYPGADPHALVPGALVFSPTAGPVDLRDWRQWWSYTPGAQWRHPRGPAVDSENLDDHPVTQIAYEDALAYAGWAGKALPTEAEWEWAARGGLEGATYSWGEELEPGGMRMANIWVGDFPWQFRPGRGQTDTPGTTAVGSYPPNGYGLLDMTGNVWEWTGDHYRDHHQASQATSCCAPANPVAAHTSSPSPSERFARRVTKGGSHLCAANYCLRYRPAARQGQDEDSATCHIGFRCVVRDPS